MDSCNTPEQGCAVLPGLNPRCSGRCRGARAPRSWARRCPPRCGARWCSPRWEPEPFPSVVPLWKAPFCPRELLPGAAGVSQRETPAGSLSPGVLLPFQPAGNPLGLSGSKRVQKPSPGGCGAQLAFWHRLSCPEGQDEVLSVGRSRAGGQPSASRPGQAGCLRLCTPLLHVNGFSRRPRSDQIAF